MSQPIAGYGLYQALKDEGYELPPECSHVEMRRLPVNGVTQLAWASKRGRRSDESKRKNAVAARGKRASPETRAKMRAAYAARTAPKRWFGKDRNPL